MSRVKQADTTAEVEVRRLIRELGYSYRTSARDLPGSPDIVNRSKKWAIFVNGCFWHAHKNCSKFKVPKRNKMYWKEKFKTNIKRDLAVSKMLECLGYRMIVIWECELNYPTYAKRKLSLFFDEIDNSPKKINGKKLPKRNCSSRSNSYEFENFLQINALKNTVKKVPKNWGAIGKCPSDGHDSWFLRQHDRIPPESTEPAIKCADLFSGCGGLSLGVRSACDDLGVPFEASLAIDSDKIALEVYSDNFSPQEKHHCDISKILDGRIGGAITKNEASLIGPQPHFHMLVAGPPCQGHSNLNNHTRRYDERNNLYLRVVRFIELARPTYFIIENVPAIIHSKQDIVLKAKRVLKSLGYQIDSGIVSLDRLGVPQVRRRHVLIGSLNGQADVADVVNQFSVTSSRSVRWAIGDIEEFQSNTVFDAPSKSSNDNQERINYLFEENLYDLPSKLRPKCHQKKHAYKSMYGRLEYDKPAQTITTGFGSPGQGRYIHPINKRTLTPHEAARLQCFPDFFDFSSASKRTELSKLIGNAVPMPMSYVFALEFLTREGL